MSWNPGDRGEAPDWAVASFLVYVETGHVQVTNFEAPPEANTQWVLRALERATNALPVFHQVLLGLPPDASVADAIAALRQGAHPATWSP